LNINSLLEDATTERPRAGRATALFLEQVHANVLRAINRIMPFGVSNALAVRVGPDPDDTRRGERRGER
jgi:hypothetical protein